MEDDPFDDIHDDLHDDFGSDFTSASGTDGSESDFSSKKDPSSSEEPALEKLSLSEVPLEVAVELGRLHISLEALQKLELGSNLPFSLPAKMVHLTLSGKSIAEGEIVEMGDMVGVKIRKIYR